MTKRECAIIMAYTGTCMLKGEDLIYFYEYIKELMGRNIYTHQIYELSEEIKEKAKPDFIKLCEESIPDNSLDGVFKILSDMERQLDNLNMSHNKLCEEIKRDKKETRKKEKPGCFGCVRSEWDQDGCTCLLTGSLVSNPSIGCFNREVCPDVH